MASLVYQLLCNYYEGGSENMDVKAITDGLQVAMVVSDADFNIIYANKRGEEVFKALLNVDDLVGRNMTGCHKPETIEKLKKIYQDFADKKTKLHYYVMDTPDGKATVVSVPFFNGAKLGGVVEFVFESALG